MAGYYGRKKTFKEKMNDLGGKAKRAFFLATGAAVVIGGPLYYQYGTIHEEEVKVTKVSSNWDHYDSKKGESVYNYQITTAKGQVLENKNTTLHFKFNSKDIQDQLNEGRDTYSYSYFNYGGDDNNSNANKKDKAPEAKDKIWHIRYYGARIDIPFIHTYPNILSVREVTPDELQARAQAQADARKDQQQAQQQNQQQNGQQQNGQQKPNGTVTTPAPAALSGTMITFTTTVQGEQVEITAPIEAANKITVNKVTPLVPTVAPRGPGGPGGN